MLLIIDMLNDFLDRWSTTDRASLIGGVQSLAEMFRTARRPIVWVRQEFEPDLSDAFQEMRLKNVRITIKGTRGAKIVPELTPRSEDHHVIKKRYSAFFGTELDRLIAERSIDAIVLAGINTHACIRVTAIDAYQRDLQVIIPKEAVGSYDRSHGDISLSYMDGKIASVISLDELASCIHA